MKIRAPRVGMPAEDSRYYYLIGYMSPSGAFGRVSMSFNYPITADDIGGVEVQIRNDHPGATIIAISPIAPPRTVVE